MRNIVLVCAAILTLCSPCYSQLTLGPGQSWDYSFNNLPKTGSVSSFTTNPVGALQFIVNSASFQTGDLLRYDMFEESTAQTLICSGVMASTPPFDRTCTGDSAWQDREGAIRFTMLSGSATIDSITLTAIIPGPSLSSYDVYSTTFTPVPEPGAAALLGLALGASVACKVWRQTRS